MIIIIFVSVVLFAIFTLVMHKILFLEYDEEEYDEDKRVTQFIRILKKIFAPKICSVIFLILGIIMFILIVPFGFYEFCDSNVFPSELSGFILMCGALGVHFLSWSKELKERDE